MVNSRVPFVLQYLNNWSLFVVVIIFVANVSFGIVVVDAAPPNIVLADDNFREGGVSKRIRVRKKAMTI